jgi:hypothetical protein
MHGADYCPRWANNSSMPGKNVAQKQKNGNPMSNCFKMYAAFYPAASVTGSGYWRVPDNARSNTVNKPSALALVM